jgi:tol-pal system protein YbgF
MMPTHRNPILMKFPRSPAAVIALALLVTGPVPWLPMAPAAAQDYDRPPANMGEDQTGADPGGAPVDSQDPAGLAVRVGKLESRLREMTGQIEELQNANRKLVEQLQKFQTDVDSRMLGGRPKRADAGVPPVVAGSGGPAVDTPESRAPDVRPGGKPRRTDAYDPDAAPGSDPGKPKPLGATASAQPDDSSVAPMDLAGGKLRSSATSSDTLAPTLQIPSASPKAGGPTLTPGGTIIASTGPVSPRAEFDLALGYYKGKQYDDAEKGFTAFIQKNPKSRLAADATYYLGESFAQRGRSREAAEQYLKVSTDYATSNRAPDAMLHLGISLKALGAKEQACATFTEVNRKYPNAPAYVKAGAEREAKRAQC